MADRLEEALRKHLLDTTEVAAITDQVWLGDIAPQSKTLPDVLFQMTDGGIDETYDGNAEDLQFPFFEFTSRAVDPVVCVNLNTEVRKALRALRTGATITLSSGSAVIEQLSLHAQGDDVSTFEEGGTDQILYARTLLVQVGYRFETE